VITRRRRRLLQALARVDRWMAARPVAYAALVVLAAVVVLGLFVDLPLAIYLRQATPDWLRGLLAFVGQLGRAEGWVLGALVLYGLGLWARMRGFSLPLVDARRLGRYCLLLLAGLAATGALVHAVKALVGRSRPGLFFDEGRYTLWQVADGWPMESFPSGHMQVAVTVAAVLALAWPGWRVPIFALAALVGLSRMVGGAHYFADVLASAFLCWLVVRWLAPLFLDPDREWVDASPLDWLRSVRRHL